MKEIDELTIRQAAKNDQKAFRRVYDHYASFLWKVVYRTVNGDADAAREIVQDTFVRVYASLGSFAHNSALSTWLYRIAFNTANTYLAKKSSKGTIRGLDMDRLVDKKMTRDYESEDMVGALLKTMTPEERFLITSREVEGVPFEELARIVGKSSESLRTQVSRIKERLRATYGQLFKES
jgi:RNA polymerase sigma-70 factor, ECF subfamily